MMKINIPNTFKLDNLALTLELAQQLALQLIDSSDSYALLLYGAMGAGKTTLIRELGQALGIQEKITSPTFIGLNEYHLSALSFYHFDLYQVEPRLEDLSEILSASGRIVLAIEWAEKLHPLQLTLLEQDLKVLRLEFTVVDDESRELRISSIDFLRNH